MPTLADIIADTASLEGLSVEALAVLRGELMRLDALILARLTAGRNGNSDQADKLLSIEEAAAKLSTSRDWLYRRAEKLPFTIRLGRRLLFSQTGIEQFIRRRMGR